MADSKKKQQAEEPMVTKPRIDCKTQLIEPIDFSFKDLLQLQGKQIWATQFCGGHLFFGVKLPLLPFVLYCRLEKCDSAISVDSGRAEETGRQIHQPWSQTRLQRSQRHRRSLRMVFIGVRLSTKLVAHRSIVQLPQQHFGRKLMLARTLMS